LPSESSAPLGFTGGGALVAALALFALEVSVELEAAVALPDVPGQLQGAV
jgi:hypothetical protein